MVGGRYYCYCLGEQFRHFIFTFWHFCFDSLETLLCLCITMPACCCLIVADYMCTLWLLILCPSVSQTPIITQQPQCANPLWASQTTLKRRTVGWTSQIVLLPRPIYPKWLPQFGSGFWTAIIILTPLLDTQFCDLVLFPPVACGDKLPVNSSTYKLLIVADGRPPAQWWPCCIYR